MPKFQVRIVNSDFDCCDEIEAADLEAAGTQGLRSVLAIGTDDMCSGANFFGAEVQLELDGEVKKRFLVAMGQSPLK